MKTGKEWIAWCWEKISRAKQKMGKEQWIIVLIIGILLAVIVWPSSKNKQIEQSIENQEWNSQSNADQTAGSQASGQQDSTALTYEEQLEERLSRLLSQVKGAGKVTVMITLESSSELVLQTDESSSSSTLQETDKSGGSRNSSESAYSRETVITGSDDLPYVIKEINPQVSGVLVLAEGAASASVKNELYEAVQALFNLPIHKIKVLEAE